MELVKPEQNTLDHFISFLFSGLEGYAYLAAMVPGDKTSWQQEFFQYPQETDRLKQVIRGATDKVEVYLAPALYQSPKDGSLENFKVSNVVWTEFDGNAPDWSNNDEYATPSLIVQSSSESNQHVYWRLDSPITNPQLLENINRRITYNMAADSSAWDATQVLRPPETYNHKRHTSVTLVESNDYIYDVEVFNHLPDPPKQEVVDWELSALPDADEVILRYSFTPDIARLLKLSKDEVTDRSASLMNAAYGCAQMDMSNNEIMVILLMLDNRWEKFKGRKDQMKRLSHIITVARNKYPEEESTDDEDMFLYAVGFESLILTDITINWVIEPMLKENGYMLFVGPSGVGKTQLSLQLLIHLCLGKDYLHYKIAEPKKLLFLSLEMGHGELKEFLMAMRKSLSEDEVALLEENFIIVPLGEPLALNTAEGQSILIRFIEEVKPDGLFIDSVGSAVSGNISKDENVLPFVAFNDKIRKKYDLFTWFIHHVRKSNDNGGGPTQDDIYGNQYLLNRASSSYGMYKAKGDSIRVKNFKNRLAKTEDDYFIKRTEHLNFEPAHLDVDEGIKANIVKKNKKNEETVTTENGKFDL